MNRLVIHNTLRFAGLILLQVLVFDHMHAGNWIHLYPYVYFILCLPFAVPAALSLILAFLMGISLDIFSNGGGIHAASAVLTAYLRPAVLRLLMPAGGYEDIQSPSLSRLRFSWFLPYASALIVLHLFTLFMLESMSLQGFGYLLLKVLLSGFFTLAVVVCSELIFRKAGTR